MGLCTVIERLDKKNLKTQIIPFNLRGAISERNSSDNVELLAGDVITVLSQKDLKIPAGKQAALFALKVKWLPPACMKLMLVKH